MHLPQQTITRHDFLDAQPSDDQVLLVVFLRGGADGLTLVPPTGDEGYYRARPILAVKASDTISLTDYFSLNSHLEPLLKYYESGGLGIVHGAGSEDTTRSHFEAQDTMEHGGNLGSGWLGRFMRVRGTTASALSAVAIGTTTPESLRGAPAGAVMQSLRDFSFGEQDPDIVNQLAALYAGSAGILQAPARNTIAAVHKLREIRAKNEPPDSGAVYPETTFGRGLREIAKLIKADIGLAATTIDLNGWDTHFIQGAVINNLMGELAAGVDAFLTDLGEERRRVSVVVMTEFGRRLKENTSFGTDHGRGGVMLVLGRAGQVAGLAGTVRSGWPDLSPDNLDEIGDVPAAINYRDILAPVLEHHSPGVDMDRVFPGHTLRSLGG